MTQFVVYANADAASKRHIPFWLNVQSDLIDATGSRVMVPLITLERDAYDIVTATKVDVTNTDATPRSGINDFYATNP